MPDAHDALAEQFDDMPQQQEAATLGMWTFLATEVLFFGGMFMAYIIYRSAYPQAFADGQPPHRSCSSARSTRPSADQQPDDGPGRPRGAGRAEPQSHRALLAAHRLSLALVLPGRQGLRIPRGHLTSTSGPGATFPLGPAAAGADLLVSLLGHDGLHAFHVTVGVGLLRSLPGWPAREVFEQLSYTRWKSPGFTGTSWTWSGFTFIRCFT